METPIEELRSLLEMAEAELLPEGNTLHGLLVPVELVREIIAQPVATDTNTGDTISRQQAIDRFNVIRPVDPKKDEYTKGIDVGIAMCIVAVKDQSSAQKKEYSCDGCKFCGQFEYQFPCKVCIRKEKDYYARPD